MNFLGYSRPDGSAGIRNHVLIIPSGLLAAKICDFVASNGPYFVDNWMSMGSIFAGYSAAGAQLVIFQLGGGG